MEEKKERAQGWQYSTNFRPGGQLDAHGRAQSEMAKEYWYIPVMTKMTKKKRWFEVTLRSARVIKFEGKAK